MLFVTWEVGTYGWEKTDLYEDWFVYVLRVCLSESNQGQVVDPVLGAPPAVRRHEVPNSLCIMFFGSPNTKVRILFERLHRLPKECAHKHVFQIAMFPAHLNAFSLKKYGRYREWDIIPRGIWAVMYLPHERRKFACAYVKHRAPSQEQASQCAVLMHFVVVLG